MAPGDIFEYQVTLSNSIVAGLKIEWISPLITDSLPGNGVLVLLDDQGKPTDKITFNYRHTNIDRGKRVVIKFKVKLKATAVTDTVVNEGKLSFTLPANILLQQVAVNQQTLLKTQY